MSGSPLSPREIRPVAAAYAELEPGTVTRRWHRSRDEITRAVPGPVRSWAGPLLLAAAVLAFDAADRRIPFGVWTTGPVDEVAHLSTATLGLLILARFIDAPRRFYVAALIASVAIDADHIPLYLGLLGNQARPVTHSLSTVAVFAAAAAVSRRHRAVLAGMATGLVLHFARDIAEGYPGVRVFWPLQDTSWMVGYRWFLGLIVVFTVARLALAGASLPRTRIPVFRTSSPSGPGDHTGGGAAGVRRIWFFPARSRTRSASCGSTGRMWAAHQRAASGSGEGSQNSGPE
jgi:hypothetical protein